MEERKRKMEEDEDQPSGWNRVEIDDTPVDIKVTFTLFQLNDLQLYCNTGELGYDRLNETRKIGPSYAKSVIYI